MWRLVFHSSRTEGFVHVCNLYNLYNRPFILLTSQLRAALLFLLVLDNNVSYKN